MIDDERGESDQERRMEQETNAKVIFGKKMPWINGNGK